MNKERDVLQKAVEATPRVELPQAEIVSGTLESLASFSAKEPQKDSSGRFRYLLTGGLAVEAITGVSRFHHDTDLVIFDFRDRWWQKYDTDNVDAQRYWANLSFDPVYLEETAWKADYNANGENHEIYTVHPATILVQKLSDAWDRLPRERDYKDASELIIYRITELNDDPSWNSVAQKAFFARSQIDFLTDRDPFHRLVFLTMQIRESLGPSYIQAFRERAEAAHPHLAMRRRINA